MLRRFVGPSACALMTSLPVLNNCSILDARRTLIHKSVTRKLQKGKQLRKSSPTATVQASTKSLNAAPKRSSAALKAKEGKPSKHAPRKSSVTTTTPPATLKYDHDEYADDCTAEEVQFANTEQVVGIFRRSYEAPDADQLEARILHQTDAYGGTSMRDGESSSTLSASQRRQRLRSIQLRNINHVAVPPVEVPTVHQRRGGAFLPRELLRRVMREEAGTSVSSRFVSQSCLVRQRPQTVVSPSPRPQVLKPTTSHIKIHVSTAGGPMTNAPTAQSMNSTTPSHDAQTSTTKNHHPQQSITPMELHEAALVGDAALLMEETANLMPSVLSQAISDDRTSTSIEEAGEDGSVKMPQDDRASTLEHIKGTPVDLTTPNTTTTKSLRNRRDEPSSRIGADVNDLDAANQADDDVTTMGAEEGDHTSMNDAEDDEKLTAEEEKALLPWANGTLIPLSSNYITRSERQDPFFAPFTPLPTAKRIAVVQQEPLMTRMPPLSGVAMYGTVVAVKVLHNTRESLELAAASSKRQVGGESTTSHPATSKIVLDRYAPDHVPRIVVHIMDDEDNVDMGKFLFEL